MQNFASKNFCLKEPVWPLRPNSFLQRTVGPRSKKIDLEKLKNSSSFSLGNCPPPLFRFFAPFLQLRGGVKSCELVPPCYLLCQLKQLKLWVLLRNSDKHPPLKLSPQRGSPLRATIFLDSLKTVHILFIFDGGECPPNRPSPCK